MSMVFSCGNCECSPCECELQDAGLNLKLKPDKYYKKMHWPNEVYFKVDRLGKGTYVSCGTKVSSTVLSSNELVECDVYGKIK